MQSDAQVTHYRKSGKQALMPRTIRAIVNIWEIDSAGHDGSVLGCQGSHKLPAGKALKPLNSASISALNQLHTLDGSIALVPRVIESIYEDIPRLL
jgi:hypothetical protein